MAFNDLSTAYLNLMPVGAKLHPRKTEFIMFAALEGVAHLRPTTCSYRLYPHN